MWRLIAILNNKILLISLVILLLGISLRSVLPHQVLFYLLLGVGFIVMSFSYMTSYSTPKQKS